MIFLHHPESELSRTLLAALPSGATSLDCAQGLPADYTGPQPSAYPSVIVDVPAYAADVPALDADGGLLGMKAVKEFGELMAELGADLADNDLAREECDRIEREGHEAVTAIMGLLKLVSEIRRSKS